MAFPETLPDFADLVASMRALGVTSAFGVTLGPPPSRAEVIEKTITLAPPAEQERLNKELAEERHRIRVEKARDDMRLLLAASGVEYSNDHLDKLIGPIE